MDLLFFDLDGTLLNSESEISNFTQETLVKLKLNNIAYSAATGRTMLTGTDILRGHGFELPQVWRPIWFLLCRHQNSQFQM